MKGQLTISLGALALSTVAVVTTFRVRDSGGAEEVPAVVTGAAASQADLLARMQSLTNRVELLALATNQQQPMPLTQDAVSREEFDTLRAEVQQLLAKRDLPAMEFPVEPTAFKEQVAETLSAIRKEEMIDAVRSKQEKQSERLDDTMPKLQVWLDLSAYQTDEMRVALEKRFERAQALVQLWEDGVDGELLGEYKANDREAFQEEIGRFLSAEQYATFVAAGK
jgi:hypothetical protein